MATKQDIDDFLSRKRLAVVGVSRSEKDFTRLMFREFVKRGYDVVPVNPGVEEVEGRRCYARVQDIAPAVEGVLVMTPASVTEAVARDCAAAGVPRLWMYRAVNKGAVSEPAKNFCAEHGITVTDGCPFMFFRRAGFPHNIHGLLAKIAGSYPK